MFNNIKNIPYYIFGSGSFNQLGDLIQDKRGQNDFVVFCIDFFFKGKKIIDRLPIESEDKVYYIDTSKEPKTTDIDRLRSLIQQSCEKMPCCIVGIGGGSVLDTTKAISNLMTNPGKAEDYQGWDLVKNPGIFKIGIPTLSGTGAEVSRTCVLTNEKRGIKLGMNSDYSMFDQLVLDPDLTKTVSRNQFFFTGMDTYMHCIETLKGRYRNSIVDSFSQKAVSLCKEIFLSEDMMAEENLEKIMVASYLGGCAAGNVGLIHPLSAGLSIVLKYRHGISNCHAMSVVGDFYPNEFEVFNLMMQKQDVSLPKGICKELSSEDYNQLYKSTVIHEKPLANALGDNFDTILTRERVISLFKQM